MEGAAFLVDEGRIDILLDLDGENGYGIIQSEPEASDFETYQKLYLNYAETVGEVKPTESGGVVLSSKYIFGKLNHAINTSNIMMISSYKPIGGYPFSEKIGLPSEDAIDCTATRNCSADHIDCTSRRDCTATKDCGGYKWYQAPDKARCELEKSAAKLDCERIKSQNKLGCETNKSAWKIDCGRIKSQQKLTCEAEKEIVKRINRTGNFANVKGNVNVTAEAAIALKNFHFSGETILSTVELEATARFDTEIHFTPLDIVGHMACQASWRDKFSASANIPKQNLEIAVSYSIEEFNSGSAIVVKVAPISISGSTHPSPKSLILNSQVFTIHCLPLAGLIRVVDIVLPNVIPDEINGEIKVEQKEIEFFHAIDPLEFIQGEIAHKVKIKVDKDYVAILVD